MTILITIGSFLAVIIVLVMAHEIGHFVTAKASGIKVEEFGLFYPPRLLSFKKGDTVYSLNALPLGGFVKMAGEEDPDVKNSLASKSYGVRLLVLSSGSLMNFILPVILFSVAFMIPHNSFRGDTVIVDISSESPAEAAGLLPGDILLEVNGHTIQNSGDVSRYFQANTGKEISILFTRGGDTTETVYLTPRWNPPPGDGAVGVLVTTENGELYRESLPFWRAIPKGVSSCIETFVLFKNGIVSMIIGTVPVELAGPVGIAQLTGEVARVGISPLLEFAAFLSINLAIINIFPLPALDGGRIAFVLLEWVRRGKRISAAAEGKIHLVGFALLMTFFLAVTFQDIMRIINGQSLIP